MSGERKCRLSVIFAYMPRKASPSAQAPLSVVVAWTEDARVIAPGQKAWRHDLGGLPKFVDVKEPRAAMWMNKGTRSDVEKAKAWVMKEHPTSGNAFAYPTSEKDPLGRARRDILSSRQHASRPSSAQLDREIAEVVPGWIK